MLSALADLIVSIFQALVEMTLWLGDLATRPLRFLFSRQYRQHVRHTWRLHPVRAWFEFIGGSVVLVLFLAMISFWTLLITVRPTEPTPAEQKRMKSLKQRVIEKFKRPKEKDPKASNHAMERTAARPAFTLCDVTILPLRSTFTAAVAHLVLVRCSPRKADS